MSLTSLFSDIADAIRAKTGDSSPIVANNFPTAIANIPSGSVGGNLGTVFDYIMYSDFSSFLDVGVTSYYLPIRFGYNDSYADAFSSQPALRHIKVEANGTQTDCHRMFYNCTNLDTVEIFDTQYVTTMNDMFGECTFLRNVPQFNTSSVTTMSDMFNYCSNLTSDSLNNILGMCASATNYSGTKTLTTLGISASGTYPSVDFTQLSNYSAFTSAGWTLS